MILQRHISEKGLKLIKEFEGFSPTIYLDSAVLPTIGYGHLILPNEKHLFQHGVNKDEATSILKQDLLLAQSAVTRLITTPLNNNQFDALASFTFNLGAGALQRSTLRIKVNRGEHEDVPAEFIRFVWAGGKKIPGLLRRRKAEAELYLS